MKITMLAGNTIALDTRQLVSTHAASITENATIQWLGGAAEFAIYGNQTFA